MRSPKQLIMGVLGIAAALSLITALVIWPNYREAASVRQQVRELTGRLQRLGDRTHEADLLTREVQAARLHVQNDLKIVPESADVASLIRKLSYPIDGVTVTDQTFTAGSPSDAVVTALTTGPDTAGGQGKHDRRTAQAMPVTAEMSATFESVQGLIATAESMSRLVRVASVRLSCQREDQKSEIPLLKASVGLEVIYDPAPALATGAVSREDR